MSHDQQHQDHPAKGSTALHVSDEKTDREVDNGYVDAEMTTLVESQEKPTLAGELRRPSSPFSEEEEGREKKKIKETAEDDVEHKITDEELVGGAVQEPDETTHPEEKKGILEKIKEKLPGHGKAEEDSQVHTAEKKGLLEKIKEKIPGCHKGSEDATKDD